MTIPSYDPPGNLDDLDQGGRKQWSDFVSAQVDAAAQGNTFQSNDSPRAAYFNLTRTDTAPDVVSRDVTWIAFPRQVRVGSVSNRQRWMRADGSRDVQDEYCEWSVTRDAAGKITRVAFTCEPPEYWEVLADEDPDAVVELYRAHVDPSVQRNDLFDASGAYIRRNRWNTGTTRGVMHLVQSANTLSAEIELAAAATIVRVIDGRQLTGEQELVECSQYGAPQRNSDPHIGGEVNAIARMKADIALANPVGLYFNDLSTAGWVTPDGSDPKSYWTYVRGDAGHAVRAVYEVPAAKGFTVGDVTIGGRPIQFGAQITDFITMKLTAVACRFGSSAAEPMTGCVGPLVSEAMAMRTVRAGSDTVAASRI